MESCDQSNSLCYWWNASTHVVDDWITKWLALLCHDVSPFCSIASSSRQGLIRKLLLESGPLRSLLSSLSKLFYHVNSTPPSGGICPTRKKWLPLEFTRLVPTLDKVDLRSDSVSHVFMRHPSLLCSTNPSFIYCLPFTLAN